MILALKIFALIIYLITVAVWILTLELAKRELRHKLKRYHFMMALLIITSLIPILNTYLIIFKIPRIRISIVDDKGLREQMLRREINEAIRADRLADAKRMLDELEKLITE